MSFVQTVGDVTRQLGTVGGATSLVALGATSDYGEQEDIRSPVVPTSGAFSIWAPIYLGNLALVAYQALPSHRDDPVLRQIGWPLALAYGGAGIWLRAFQLNSLPVTLGLIATTTGAAALAYHRLPPPGEATTRDQWLVRIPVGLLFGWLTVASAAGSTEELLDPDVADLRIDRDVLGVASIAAVTTIAGAVTVGMDRTLAYPAAVAWGLGGIIVAQAEERPVVAVAAAVGLAVLGVASAVALFRRRRVNERSRR